MRSALLCSTVRRLPTCVGRPSHVGVSRGAGISAPPPITQLPYTIVLQHQARMLASTADTQSPPILKSDSNPEKFKPNTNAEFIYEHHIDPIRAVFPWRHSESPLPRLIPGSDEYKTQGGYVGPNMPPLNKWVRGAMHWNAASMLNVPWYQIWFFRQWEEELSNQFAWAFQMAVAGLLSNTYRVPMENILSTPGDEGANDENKSVPASTGSLTVNFDQTVPPPPHPTDITEETPKPEDDYDEESAPDMQHMMEEQLRNLYETAHEHTRHHLQIHLQSEAVQAEIVSLFMIPFLTREKVEATPALRHSFRHVWEHIAEQEVKLNRKLSAIEAIREIATELETLAKKQADSDDFVESTIIAQVAIRCKEIFKVTDVDLNQVVQGDPEGKVNDVTHLVRFEMVLKAHVEDLGPSIIGSWQITDIDDLLDGNVWYT